MQLDPKTVQKLFFIAWGGLLLASLIFWHLASPQLKRKAWPYGVLTAGAIMLLFIWFSGGKKEFYFALVPVMAIIFLNIQTVRICARCGQSNRPTQFFSPASFCSKCGAALER